MSRWIALTLVGLTLVCGLYWWRRNASPNILLISIDSLRPDYLSCYDGHAASTPHIDALASAGVLFDTAVCDVPWTRASQATLLTGRDAATHRVRSLIDRLSDVPTLAETLKRAGYRTHAIVSDFELDSIYGLDRGFDRFDDSFTEPLTGIEADPIHLASIYFGDAEKDRAFRRTKLQFDSMRGDHQTTDAALGFLQAASHPFFLWVHYFGAHERWRDPAGVEGQARQYPRAVEALDKEVGRLLDGVRTLGLQQRTVIVLHGNHGQTLWEHGVFGHGSDLYESSVHVPLMISWPGHVPVGRRIAALVSLADVWPTLADLAGFPAPIDASGRSARAAIEGQQQPERRVYLETFLPSGVQVSQEIPTATGETVRAGKVYRGVRSARWKYILTEPHALIDVATPAIVSDEVRRAATREELYDVVDDPRESINLIEREPALASSLREWVEAYGRSQHRGAADE